MATRKKTESINTDPAKQAMGILEKNINFYNYDLIKGGFGEYAKQMVGECQFALDNLKTLITAVGDQQGQ